MGDMTTIHLCMCFVQKSVFLITCPVQRDVLLSNYMHADVAKRDSVFGNFSMCKRSIYSNYKYTSVKVCFWFDTEG